MGFEISASLTCRRHVVRSARTVCLIAAIALSPLSGCVSYAPKPLQPPEELLLLGERAEQDVYIDHQGPWQASWFPLEANVQLADGLTLSEANALALFYSPSVLEARAEVRVAGAQVLQAGLLKNPELFLGPRISTEDSKLIFPAGIRWELPLWGKRQAERELAGARLTAKQLHVIEVELGALQEVRESFIRLGRLQREETILAAVSVSSQQIVTWVERLQSASEVDAVVLYLARTERDEAKVALETVLVEARRVRRELFALLGLLPNAKVTLMIDAASSILPELPKASHEALLGVPALRVAAAAYAAAEAALRLEISKQYPEIRLGPEFEDDRGDPSIGFGLGITLPLFDRNKGGIAAAEESRQRSRQRYQTALLHASHAEARARDELGTAERLLRIHLEGAMLDADEAAHALQIRLGVGRADVIEVLTAQRSIARARVRMIELEEQAAIARLRAAVTGGLALERRSSLAPEEIEK